MSDLPILPSTVAASSPESLEGLATASSVAAADASVLSSELQPAFQVLLSSLAANGAISEDDPLKQLAETVPEVAAFIAKLQESLFEAKANSVEGLLLQTQLEQNEITQEQFQSQVEGISLTPAQAQAAVATDLTSDIQTLLLSVTSDTALKKIDAILTSTTPVEGSDAVALEETEFDQQDQEKALSTLNTLIEGIVAGQSSIETAEADFVQQVLNSLPGVEGFSAEDKAKLQAQISAFLVQVLGKLGSIASLVAAAQEGQLASTTITNLDILAKPKLPSNAVPVSAPVSPKLASGALLSPMSTSKLTTDFNDENLGFFQKLFKTAAAIAAQNLKASASSLLSLNPQPRIMTGARAVIKINGEVAALCTGVNYEISMDWSEVRGIDELIPNDLAPNSFSVKGSFSIYRIPNGSPIAKFIHPDMFRGILWPYTTIEVRDKRTDEVIFLIKRCAITSRSESYTKGQLTTTTMSFIGIGFRDEELPELLPETTPEIGGSSGIQDFLTTPGSLLA